MFSLESIKAKHGDCLILRWGTKAKPGIALIDGGPPTVYEDFLRPRLVELAEEFGDGFEFDLTMLSHIDEDHIGGLLDLSNEIEQGGAPATIGLLWHNSLEGLLDHKFGGGSKAATASVGATFPGVAKIAGGQAVLASVPQGQRLDAFAKRQGIQDSMNMPFDKIEGSERRLVVARKAPAPIKGLKLRVIGPSATQIEALRKAWVKNRKEGITAAFEDESPYNLSSIVAIASFGGKKMLLTGDARGDMIIEGLCSAKLMNDGKFHIDLFKLPHHGSENNVDTDFFKKITADVYVVSGDLVRFPNPNRKAMKWLAEARGDDEYLVYCPYDLPHMRKIFGDRLVVPEDGATSVTVTF